jgi:hypothetical protein
MSTLVIEDLPVSDEMDRPAMANVSGGQLPQQILDIVKFVDDYTHGRCDNNGVSIVCY